MRVLMPDFYLKLCTVDAEVHTSIPYFTTTTATTITNTHTQVHIFSSYTHCISSLNEGTPGRQN